MNNKNFDDRLLKILEKEVLKEKWKKKSKIIGIVISKKTTKKGSFMFTIKTKKSKYDVVVPVHRKEEFGLAKNIEEGDIIKAIGDRQISGLIFCDRIKKLNKSSFDEKQMKLVG
jgi:RNA polymerase-interacting CarD/CdnL/TRCF family regulator